MLLHNLVVLPDPTRAERLATWPLTYGWVGVSIFFVLSGYLITGILLDTRDAPRRARNFFARRALRIMPLYVVVLAVVFAGIAAGAIAPPPSTADGASFWGLWCNLAMATAGDYLIDPLAPAWSVAVEAQFYLLWPLVVWSVRPKRLVAVSVGLAAASLGLRLYGAAADWGPIALYVHTLTRFDALMLGSAAAAAVRSGFCASSVARPLFGATISLAAVAAIGDLAWLAGSERGGFFCSPWSLGPGITLGAAATAGGLLLLVTPGAAPRLTLAMQSDWLRSFGRYSYGVYLTHTPVRALVRDYLYGPGGEAPGPLLNFADASLSRLVSLAIYIGVCTPLCWCVGAVCYHAVELPALRYKRRFSARSEQAAP